MIKYTIAVRSADSIALQPVDARQQMLDVNYPADCELYLVADVDPELNRLRELVADLRGRIATQQTQVEEAVKILRLQRFVKSRGES